ncbi:MAG: hypothetical protein DDT19_02585 [Syntrophomonadaceae bacterium]|nr:hypothetical protein [Bacillota bacterium]
MIGFQELLIKLRGPDWIPPARLLVIDPGETTGVAIFNKGQIEVVKQLTGGWAGMVQELNEIFTVLRPTYVVVEDYKVYAHKTKDHTWSSLFTPKLIGAIEALCTLQGIQPVMQMASCKQFVTNDKLRAWNMYVPGQPHARDAIRHSCYFLLFNKDI